MPASTSGLFDVAARRHGEILRIEGDEIHDRRRRLDFAETCLHAGGHGQARRSPPRCNRPSACGTSGVEMPMSPAKASAACWRIDGVCAFQPKRPSVSFAAPAVAHDVRLSGDAVAIGVVRIGVGQDVGGMDLLDKAEADHRRRHPRRQRRVQDRADHRPDRSTRVGRLAQRDGRAVAERDRYLLVGDVHPAFAGEARHGKILQLPAIDRIGKVEHLPVGDGLLLLLRYRRREPAGRTSTWRRRLSSGG